MKTSTTKWKEQEMVPKPEDGRSLMTCTNTKKTETMKKSTTKRQEMVPKPEDGRSLMTCLSPCSFPLVQGSLQES